LVVLARRSPPAAIQSRAPVAAHRDTPRARRGRAHSVFWGTMVRSYFERRATDCRGTGSRPPMVPREWRTGILLSRSQSYCHGRDCRRAHRRIGLIETSRNTLLLQCTRELGADLGAARGEHRGSGECGAYLDQIRELRGNFDCLRHLTRLRLLSAPVFSSSEPRRLRRIRIETPKAAHAAGSRVCWRLIQEYV